MEEELLVESKQHQKKLAGRAGLAFWSLESLCFSLCFLFFPAGPRPKGKKPKANLISYMSIQKFMSNSNFKSCNFKKPEAQSHQAPALASAIRLCIAWDGRPLAALAAEATARSIRRPTTSARASPAITVPDRQWYQWLMSECDEWWVSEREFNLNLNWVITS